MAKETKGLGIFMVCYTSYCAIAQDHSIGGPISTYILFALSWALFLFQIHKIELVDERYLVFYRVAKKTKIEIKNITHSIDGIRYYRLYHDKGSSYLNPMILGIESFKNKIQSINPSIKQTELTGSNLHKDIWGSGVLLHYLIFGVVIIGLLGFIGYKVLFPISGS